MNDRVNLNRLSNSLPPHPVSYTIEAMAKLTIATIAKTRIGVRKDHTSSLPTSPTVGYEHRPFSLDRAGGVVGHGGLCHSPQNVPGLLLKVSTMACPFADEGSGVLAILDRVYNNPESPTDENQPLEKLLNRPVWEPLTHSG